MRSFVLGGNYYLRGAVGNDLSFQYRCCWPPNSLQIKFYEYVSIRKPIISITNGDAEVNKIINQSKLGYTINIKKKNLSKELLKILKKRKKYKMNIKDIFKYSREYQNKKLLDILKD